MSLCSHGKHNFVSFYSQTTEVTAADLDPEFVLVQTLTKGQAFVSSQAHIQVLEHLPTLRFCVNEQELLYKWTRLYRGGLSLAVWKN